MRLCSRLTLRGASPPSSAQFRQPGGTGSTTQNIVDDICCVIELASSAALSHIEHSNCFGNGQFPEFAHDLPTEVANRAQAQLLAEE